MGRMDLQTQLAFGVLGESLRKGGGPGLRKGEEKLTKVWKERDQKDRGMRGY